MYIILEVWPNECSPSIVTDENGEVICFDKVDQAKAFAQEEVQNGVVVDALQNKRLYKLKLGEEEVTGTLDSLRERGFISEL